MTNYRSKLKYEADYLDRLSALPEATQRQAEERLTKNQTKCPAANNCGIAGVRCGIEQILLKPDTDSKTIVNLCTDDYSLCPTWRRSVNEGRTAKEHGDHLRKQNDRQEDKDNEDMERVMYDGKR